MFRIRSLMKYAVIGALALAGAQHTQSAIAAPAPSASVARSVADTSVQQSTRPTPRPGQTSSGSPSGRATPTPSAATTSGSGQLVVEEAGGFAYVPPARWQVRETALSEFKVLFAPADNSGFTANVNFNIGEFDGDLETFKELAIQELESGVSGFVLQGEETLTTAQGNDVVKLVTDSTVQGRRLRQIIYLIDFGPRKLIVTYTRLRTGQQQRDREVEAFIATIRDLNSESSSKAGRHVESAGGFSYVLPEGWQLETRDGSDFKVLVKSGATGNAKPTVAFFVADDATPIDGDFMDEYRETLPNQLRELAGTTRNVRLISDDLFTTAQGYDAAKFVAETTIAGQRAQLTVYFVDIGSGKVIALYARPRTGAATDDEAIEAMVNTIGPADAADGKQAAGRHYERRGNFSYALPEGWTLKQPNALPASANTEFAALFGPVSGNIAPNVLFFEDTLSGTFAEYLDAATQALRESGSRNISRPERMKTNDGLEFARITATRTDGGQRFQQTYYFFPERNRVIFALYTRLAQGQQSQLDKSIEAVMQSFRFGR